ncbi:MAG: AMP-dependent synthetase/ligase [Frankiaceae bacterium]
MREYTTPPVINLRPEENLTDIIFGNAAEAPDVVSLSRKDGTTWTNVTARQFADQVIGLAKGLIQAGIAPGDHIGLLSTTRYEWTLADFAILTAGAVVVPVYETSSAEQVAWNLSDSEAVAVIVETGDHAATVADVRDQLPALRHVWQIDAGDLDRLADDGESVPDSEVTERRAALTGDTLATIIYTSGTTGRPKGCELVHRNFLFDALTITGAMSDAFKEGTSTLLFLPLAHVLGRVIQYATLASKVRLGHTAQLKDLLGDLAAFQPTFVLSIPRIFEKIYNAAKIKADAGGKGRIFDLAEATAVSYSEALERGRPNPVLQVQHLLFDKLVYSKIRQSLGGEVRWSISGGAPLGARLGHFFRGAGITILEGYGLTETSAAAALNMPGAIRIGTVGRPVPGASAAIADDGEILLKGDHVFRGYWHNETATKEVLEPDGWFHTGDIGELDGDGFLRITGRKKELIITSSGKNVSPAYLEEGLRAHALISQCMIVGDRKPYIAALITLDAEALEGWKERNGKTAATVAEIKADPDLIAAIDAAVAGANKTVSRAEGIRRYRILDVDFTEAGGQMTATLKLKRNVVIKDFAEEIDALYT